MYAKKRKTVIEKDTCTPMFIAALFTIAKIWKQPKCLPTDEWLKKMWYMYTHTHTGILFSHKKEWNSAICNNMAEPREYYAHWNKSDREREILYVITYMWKLKNKTNEWTYQNRNRPTDIENKSVVTSAEKNGEGRGKVGMGIKRYELLCIK